MTFNDATAQEVKRLDQLANRPGEVLYKVLRANRIDVAASSACVLQMVFW